MRRAKAIASASRPVVQRQRAAAALPARDDHVAALGREHPGGRGVHLREEHRLHASGEHADHRPAGAQCGHALGQPPRRFRGNARRGQPQRRTEHGGDPARQAGPGQPPVKPGSLRHPQRRGQRPEPPGVREQGKDGRPRRPLPHRPRRGIRGHGIRGPGIRGPATGGTRRGRRGSRLLGPHPGRLDELVVLHARRAGGHAGHAAQAAVEVLRGRGGERGPVEKLVHQVDPAPRRVHLLGPQLVGRTGRQAEPAVHAVLRHLAQRVLVLHQSPPAKRPGNIRWSGSNWSLTARIRAAPGIVPYAGTAASTADGARSTATLPREPREPPSPK